MIVFSVSDSRVLHLDHILYLITDSRVLWPCDIIILIILVITTPITPNHMDLLQIQDVY